MIVEGAGAGSGRWTITVVGNQNVARNGLFANQLLGAKLEFRKAKAFGVMTLVAYVDISNVQPASRITFEWVRDT